MVKRDKYLIISSNIPGRIRFKINLLYNNANVAKYFYTHLMEINEIHSVNINIYSQSLLIKYDNKKLNANKLYNSIKKLIGQYVNIDKEVKENMKYAAIASYGTITIKNKTKARDNRSKISQFQNIKSDDKEWYKMTVHEIISLLNIDTVNGLKTNDINNLLDRYGPNRFNRKKKKSILSMFFNQFSGYLMKILLGACVLSVFLGQIADAITIFTIVVVEAILGVWQNYKAEKSLDTLEKYASQTSKVLRDGKMQVILSENLVPGDIIIFESGDIIPADGRLINSSNLQICESSLTGESEFSEKSHKIEYTHNICLADRKNMVYSGTRVMKGNGKAIVVNTGMKTEMGMIANILEDEKIELTPLQKDLNKLSKVISFICISISLVVIISGLLAGQPFLEIIRTGLSLAIGAIPEGLTTILTISLAFGVQRMAAKGAIVKELPSVETLSCADVICTDKTGTLTTGTMTVTEIHTLNKKYTMRSNGEFADSFYRINAMEDRNLMQLITVASLCNNAQLSVNDNNAVELLGDATETALMVLGGKFNLSIDHFKCYTRVKEEAFDSELKKMTVICKDTSDNYTLNVKGAVDVVLTKCTKILDNGLIREITNKDRDLIFNTCDNMAENALRVLAFAYKEVNNKYADEENLIFIGTVGIIDPPRPEVKKAIRKCHKAGIKVIMITGDHKKTAAAIGNQLNLLDEKSIILTGEELDELSDKELNDIIDDVVIFARTSPNQKLRIVRALKDKGHIVAMTGDGINDAPAIKEANIGIAMGKSGTDVTKETASIVLTDDNFTTIVKAIEEGRGISGNVKRFLRYVLSGNIGSVIAVLAASLLRLPSPLISSQILMINLVTEGVPALALGLDSPNENVMNESPRDACKSIFDKQLLKKILSRGLLMGISTFGLFTGTYLLTGNLVRARTLAYASIVINQMFHVFDCREKNTNKNKYILPAIVIAVLTLLASIYIPSANGLFGTCPLTLIDWVALSFMACFIGRLDYLKDLASRLVNNRLQPINSMEIA
ncbi:MAG: HAD-IC family P-type ATPase [Sedimentibacter sp.]